MRVKIGKDIFAPHGPPEPVDFHRSGGTVEAIQVKVGCAAKPEWYGLWISPYATLDHRQRKRSQEMALGASRFIANNYGAEHVRANLVATEKQWAYLHGLVMVGMAEVITI